MRNNLKQLLEKLLQQEVDFVLAGGFACVVHGSPLITQDIDICLAINEEQIGKLRTALSDLNPRHRMNPSYRPSFMEYPLNLEGVKNIYLETDLGVLDILSVLQPVGGFETVKRNSISIPLYGHICRVVSIEDLIRIKKTMTRPKDKETLLYLEKVLERHKKR